MNFLSNIPAWQHLMKYKSLMYELITRDLKIKYRKSFLGYLWSLLNPLLMMVIMTVVFSTFFKSNIENFPLYLICGQTMWTFFNESTTVSMNAVIENGSLIKKVYIPKFIFPVSKVFSSFVTMGFNLVAIVIVMIFTQSHFYVTALLFIYPLICLLIFSMGVGMFLSSLSVYFRDMLHLYSVLTLGWMYATPIFYPIEIVPESVRFVLQLNPIYHYITFFRQVVIYGQIPAGIEWAICIGFSVIAIIIGALVFNRLQKNFILYL